LNHIDMSACKDRDIKILSLKNEQDFLSTVRATPEHTLGLILSLLRNYAHAFNISKLEECNREIYRGGELYGNRVGIIGFGRVGKILSRYLQAIGAKRVFYFDIDDSITSDGFSIKSNSIYELINASNIIILSASFSEGYREFIGKHVIDSMKEKFFINTSRGELVDEEYLIEKIKKHHFNGVAVDVVSNDSEVCNYIKYMTIPEEINFIFTPHIAGITHESMHKTEMFIYKKLVNFLDNS